MRVLCIADYFLPGYRAGGPIRTLSNMRELLKGEVKVSIFTRDRDLGCLEPYADVRRDAWISDRSGSIFYASPRNFNASKVLELAGSGSFDLLYLNSFFSFRGSISIVFQSWIRKRFSLPILLAPRGEFSSGALLIKKRRKRMFLMCARLLGFYKWVHWHASTAREAQDILRQFPRAGRRIHLAADPIQCSDGDVGDMLHREKDAGNLKLVFVSRISPMKNLKGLLQVLAGVERDVLLTVFGPVEDQKYWIDCRRIISNLPANVVVDYKGELSPEDVGKAFRESDIFAFPTKGENFGHVIFESLRVGTPVLLSDQTPWRDTGRGGITVVPLGAIEAWRREIKVAADRTKQEQSVARQDAIEFARRYSQSSQTKRDNLAMFFQASGK